MTTQEKAEVMLAHADGKLIQVKHKSESDSGFIPCKTPSWDWSALIYRVKPRGPRRIWVVRDNNDSSLHAFDFLYSAATYSGCITSCGKPTEFVEVIK